MNPHRRRLRLPLARTKTLFVASALRFVTAWREFAP